MAKWRCNAPEPGSYLQGRGIVRTGVVFQTPDDPEHGFFERARESWIPLDAGAERLVEKAKEDAKKMSDDLAREAAERKQAEEDARNGVTRREFKTRPEVQGGGTPRYRPAELTPTEEEKARDEGWRREHEKQVNANLTPEQQKAREAEIRTYERDRQARASGGQPPDSSSPPADADVQPRRPPGTEPALTVGQVGPHPITGSTPEEVAAERSRQQQGKKR